jgi:spore cortex biosynthesis protein YabQ
VTLHVQFLTLWMMFCSGLVLGAMFDIFRVLSGKLRLPRWTQPLVDIIYWIVATILVFKLLYFSNEGQVRVFVFLGILIGICFYFAFLSMWVIRAVLLLIRFILALYRLVKRIVEIFVITPVVGLYRLLLLFLGILAAVAIFLYKIMLQLLYPIGRLLLRLGKSFWKYLRVPSWWSRLYQMPRKLIKKIVRWFRR